MKKEVNLCETCYAKGKEIVCDSACYYCGKSICKDCEKKLIIDFKDDQNVIRRYSLAPLCPDCLIKFASLPDEFHQNLVNVCGQAFYHEAKKQEQLNNMKVKSEEEDL